MEEKDEGDDDSSVCIDEDHGRLDKYEGEDDEGEELCSMLQNCRLASSLSIKERHASADAILTEMDETLEDLARWRRQSEIIERRERGDSAVSRVHGNNTGRKGPEEENFRHGEAPVPPTTALSDALEGLDSAVCSAVQGADELRQFIRRNATNRRESQPLQTPQETALKGETDRFLEFSEDDDIEDRLAELDAELRCSETLKRHAVPGTGLGPTVRAADAASSERCAGGTTAAAEMLERLEDELRELSSAETTKLSYCGWPCDEWIATSSGGIPLSPTFRRGARQDDDGEGPTRTLALDRDESLCM
mmetsp:Transcript_14065/g.26540  ORF Transcript_14065/g.26540 Transcript_14065/m.26540 type:complete len:307 (-) Transcript_14065:42-962(-)